ncbi:hypothetical protein C1645_841233 [Glomus cerebriforme]|uniref:Uncharacterized protein n=1 Tax=Glomus cerebriforme TaxID=658196 RepID=A0A397S3C6_9GLOM|nr:hypothetical protein C1645_841233 [Glomus cerebriforme]
MLKNLEYKQAIYSQNKTIKKLKEKITLINNKAENVIETDIIVLNNTEIQKSVKKEIEEKKLELVIFMSTLQYLFILLSLPYTNCLDLIISNQIFYIRVSGFNISCVIIYLLCKILTQYSNEDSGVKYSHLVVEAMLTGGTCMFKPIIDSAKSNCEVILYKILDHLESTSQEKVLQIGFDYSWSHFCNAHQASGEFLYLDNLSDI